MPINAYVSGSLSVCRANLEIDGDSSYSKRGPGLTLSAGKEWWVSDNWGLGVALIYHYSKMEADEGDDWGGMHDLVNNYYGVAFSATYN